MSDVGEIAKAVSSVTNLVYGELHPAQQEQLKDAYDRGRAKLDEWEKAAMEAVDTFESTGKSDLRHLAHLWRGCLSTFTTHLSEDSIRRFEQMEVRGVNLNEWTGQYACAVSSDFFKECVAIIKTNEDTSRS